MLFVCSSLYSEEWKALYKINPITQRKTQVSEYDFDEIDPLNNAPFRELLQEAKNSGANLIIAQPTYTDDRGREITMTYDALTLLRYLFGPNFLSPNEHRYNTLPPNFPRKDPLSREPYLGPINLFLINDDGTGEYIGNDLQLHSKMESEKTVEIAEKLLTTFSDGSINEYLEKVNEIYENAQQEENIDLANVYYRDLSPYLFILNLKRNVLNPEALKFVDSVIANLRSRNFETALSYLQLAVDQNIDLLIKADTQFLLGKKYYEEGPKEIGFAYLQSAADQNINAFIQAAAQSFLSWIYAIGVDKSDQAALFYLQPAAQQNINLEAKATAQYFLGRIYLFGNGVQKDLQTAYTYLQSAAQQDSNESAKNHTQLLIKQYQLQELEEPEEPLTKKRKIDA